MPVDPARWAAWMTAAAVWSALHGFGRMRPHQANPRPRLPIGRLRALRWRRPADGHADVDRDLLEIATGLQAGLDFDAALAGLAGKPPWSHYVDLRRAGVPAHEAASGTLQPICPELAAVLKVYWRFGGPLADMLLMIADDRSRKRQLDAELRARSSEARATAWLLALMSPGLGLYLLIREPQLLSPLLTEPLGGVALVAAAALWSVGLVLLQRLLRDAS